MIFPKYLGLLLGKNCLTKLTKQNTLRNVWPARIQDRGRERRGKEREREDTRKHFGHQLMMVGQSCSLRESMVSGHCAFGWWCQIANPARLPVAQPSGAHSGASRRPKRHWPRLTQVPVIFAQTALHSMVLWYAPPVHRVGSLEPFQKDYLYLYSQLGGCFSKRGWKAKSK